MTKRDLLVKVEMTMEIEIQRVESKVGASDNPLSAKINISERRLGPNPN